MKEKDIQTTFKQKNTVYGVFELKLCKGTSMPFSHIADHQVKALLAVEDDGLYHKIADSPVSWGGQRFSKEKPFDCFFLRGIPAYIVVVFYVPMKKKTAYYIRIHDYLNLYGGAKRKSMTEAMAAEFAEQTVEFLEKKKRG